MSPASWTFLGIVVAAVVGATGGGVNALVSAWRQRRADKSADWQAYTDDLMSRVEALQARVTEQDKSIGDLWAARREDQAVISEALGHIALLERGIIAGTVPPLPPRPARLGG